MPENRKICFVIMPFSKTSEKHTEEYWTAHFESFLKPLIGENPDLEAKRSEPLRGDILRQIITDLVTCPVVVADLTDSNPNVYWELGVRQSFKHGTVTVAEEGPRLPFDTGGKGTLFYDPKDHLKMERFRKRFKEATKDCLKNPERPDSHVLETISGRGTLFEIFRRDEALRRLDAVLSECNRNLETLNDAVIKQAKENQNKTEERQFPTIRFAASAVQLLTVDRYIDEDQSFFELAEEYATSMHMLNSQLDAWEHHPESVEEWLMEYGETLEEPIVSVKAVVARAREKLSRRL